MYMYINIGYVYGGNCVFLIKSKLNSLTAEFKGLGKNRTTKMNS